MSLVDLLKNYYILDKSCEELSKRLKQQRSKKNEIETKVITVIKQNNLENKVISINDKTLSLHNQKSNGTFSQKLVREVLEEMNIKEEIIAHIFNQIQQKRDRNTKENMVLKIK